MVFEKFLCETIRQTECNAYVDGKAHKMNYITSSSSYESNRIDWIQLVSVWERKCEISIQP